jgi:hypothetical protein
MKKLLKGKVADVLREKAEAWVTSPGYRLSMEWGTSGSTGPLRPERQKSKMSGYLPTPPLVDNHLDCPQTDV